MTISKSFGMACFAFFMCAVGAEAAADFKIRYNQKFPCLEVMDSNAVKITDVTEGAKGETVTSGKSSLNISFIKNSSGQPEVTLRDAKSPLSEMEIEAFGLSVGMKPEGTVLVRFGADNKPKFEMDRTGGSRFLMADLGNLDTAAGKEVAANGAPSKNLIRCRERFADWIGGKGGWSNKSGKILATEGGDSVKVGDLPDREIKVSESFQLGALITVGAKKPLLFQSGAGVFHLALPGTVFSLGKLETGSSDLKIELTEGTIQTFVAEPLKAPRSSLIALGNGEVVRTLDASYQIARTSGQESAITLTSISGNVVLAQEAGGQEVATLSGEKTWSGAKGGEPRALSANSPEKSSLVALEKLARNTALIDIARDGVKACPEAVEEIVSTAVKANPDLAQSIAEQCLLANPKLLQGIAQASGVKGLKLSKEEQAKVDALESLDQRLKRLATDGIDLEMKLGQVLLVEGDCNLDGKKGKIMVGQVLALNDKITTGKSSRILIGMAPGVVLSVEAGSVASLEKMSAEIKNGELQNRGAVVNSESGLVVMNIAPWNKEKTDVRVKTTDGESVAQGTVFAVSIAGGKMMTTVTRGTVGSRDSSGKMVSIPAGQQAAPGATPVATSANSPAVLAAGKAVESTVHAMVANVAASVAAAIPTAAAEVATIAAKAAPGAAEQIAAAVAAKAPEAAIAIAQAVSKVAPEAASRIAAAVIAATPGMDAKSISAITTASSQGATEAPSVDTAAGTESAGAAGGGVGAGSGNIGATTQVQQLQAQQDAKAAADALKAAADEVKRLQEQLAAAAEADKQRLIAALKTANQALDKAKSDNLAAQIALAATEKAAELKLAQETSAKELSDKISKATTKEAAVELANDAADAAAGIASAANTTQERLAGDLVTSQKVEAEQAAIAEAAQLAAQNALKLQTALSAATTKAAQEAAAKAAADTAAADATKAATAATKAAADATAAATAANDAITDTIRNSAAEYKKSSPSVESAIQTASARSVQSIFTETQLNANNGELKKFVEKWDKYIVAERDKYAADAESTAKAKAAKDAADLEVAVRAADSIAAAKAAAATLIKAVQTAATKAIADAKTAENTALEKAKLEAAAKAARDLAAAAKVIADQLAADIAAADLEAAKQKAAERALAIEQERKQADADKVAAENAKKAAEAAAKIAAEAAEKAAGEVPVTEGGTKPIESTPGASNLI